MQDTSTRPSDDAASSAARPARPTPEADAGPGWQRVAFFFIGWNVLMWSVIAPLARPVIPGGFATLAIVAVFGMLPLIAMMRAYVGTGGPPSAFARVFVMRPFWYVQLSLPFLALTGGFGALVGIPFGMPGLVGRWMLGIMAALVLTGILGGYAGSRTLTVRRLDLEFPDLPAAFDGLRIAQISDLHVGPHTRPRQLARIVHATHAGRPDFIAITGDQVDDHGPDTAHFIRAFGHLRAPLGVFAIPGNHDVYAGWVDVQRGMEAAGMTVLVNDAQPLTRGGEQVWLVGTGDPAGAQWPPGSGIDVAPDIPRAVAKIPEGAFTIALAHNPALWPALAERGIHLTLSGHTHHGQISIPFLRWSLASVFLKHSMGAYTAGRSLLYINPGTHHWGIPLRLGAWPEVTHITLRRGGEMAPRIVRTHTAAAPRVPR